MSLSRAHITQPVEVRAPAVRVSQRLIERESIVAFERVKIRTVEDHPVADYAVVNKITPIVDAEMMTVQQQDSSSLSEDHSSTSASIHDDSLTNLNLEAFEPVTTTPREIVRVREDKMVAQTSSVRVEKIEPSVRVPVKITDKRSPVRVDHARANIEPSQGALDKPLLISHPPKIGIDPPVSLSVVERQRVNVELYSTTQEDVQSILTSIRPERMKTDRVESVQIEPLRKPLNKANIQQPMALSLAREEDESMMVDEQPYVTVTRRREEPEHVQVVQIDEAKSKAEEKRVSVLNSAMCVDEHIPGLEAVPALIYRPPVVAHQIQEFVTHEQFNDHQVNSTVVIPLENLKEIPAHKPDTQIASLLNE